MREGDKGGRGISEGGREVKEGELGEEEKDLRDSFPCT